MQAQRNVLIALFCSGFLMYSQAQKMQPEIGQSIIVVDPGHGGSDSGAIALNGQREKDINLSIAIKIQELSQRFYMDSLEVFLTRYKDTLIALSNRAYLARELKPDVFISIHCNNAKSRNAKGTEVFIYPKSEVQGRASIHLGYSIQQLLLKELGIKSRGIKIGNFQVLRESELTTATILLELGFLSQTDEASYLSEENTHYAIALVILQAVHKFMKL